MSPRSSLEALIVACALLALGCPSQPAVNPSLPIAPSPTEPTEPIAQPEPAGPPAFVEPATQLPFPKSLGETSFVGNRQYDPAELGVSVRYELGLDGHADVYVYTKGITSIGEGATAPDVVAEVDSAVSDIGTLVSQGAYRDYKVQSKGVRDFGGTPFQEVRLIILAATPLESWIYLTGHRGNFIKVRTSYAASQAAQTQPIVEGMMKALGKTIATNKPRT